MDELQPDKITRIQLYNEIWEMSVLGVSKKYDVSYSKLMKLCRDNNIPTPPAGYWTSLSFGKEVEKIPLPDSDIIEIGLNKEPVKNNKKHAPRIGKAISREKEKHINKDQDAVRTEKIEADDIVKQEDVHVVRQTVVGVNNVYKREVLYKEVWEKPVIEIARHYGVSDVTIHKVCKALNIPVPPIGYWAKIKAGMKQNIIPLPPTKGLTEKIGPRSYEEVKLDKSDVIDGKISTPRFGSSLGFLDVEERQRVLNAAEKLEISGENERLHNKIIAYKHVVSEWNKKDHKDPMAQRALKNYSKQPPFLAGVISEASLSRVYRILSTIFRSVEDLGGTINDDLSLLIRNEHVRLEIVEGQDEVKHELTRQEAQALIQYQDAKRRHSWEREPQIRKYDYIFNGKLRISIRQGRYFRDTDNIQIESKLGDLLIELYEESEIVRNDRVKWEEAQQKRKEDEIRREEQRNRYNEEVEQTIELQNKALDYQIADSIRRYVDAVKNTCTGKIDEETNAWINWASNKADWFDPAIAREDEFFGKRKHEKKPGDKELAKKGYWW